MRGLLLRLSTLDAGAESAVRVIAYFDSLVRDHVGVATLLQATATLAQCPVGLYDAMSGRRWRARPGEKAVAGAEESGGKAVTEKIGERSRDLGALGTVWMECQGDRHGLDEIVMERFAAAAEVTLERTASGTDPALIELVLSAATGEPERARALRLLGFGTGAQLQVIAGQAEDGPALVSWLRARGHHARGTTVGELAVVIAADEVSESPPAVRAGVGPPVPAARVAASWEAARLALRFTGQDGRDRVVRSADLGALALFAAHVPDAAVAELADVRAVASLPPEVAAAVRALCEEGSVRRAAAAVHLHHSSMAARIARAETTLGFSLAAPAGRLRAHLALALTRLLP
ncbi:helix-turn-helix domain-containing protein [Nonomuraea roseola]|uniref:Helix-turn-helix domain-containing protein n=1 Tax=Nonomuraea roseola TaxID=46179 RepID=A0ABV5QBG9_9ACTN